METHYSHCRHTGDRWTSVHAQSVPIRPRACILYQRQTLPHTTSAKSSNKTQKTSLQLITGESPDSNNPKLKGKPDFITSAAVLLAFSRGCCKHATMGSMSLSGGQRRFLGLQYDQKYILVHTTFSMHSIQTSQKLNLILNANPYILKSKYRNNKTFFVFLNLNIQFTCNK